MFVVRSKDRDALQNYLSEKGIQTIIHYPIPPHQQEAYKELANLSFPITEIMHNEVLSLPISSVLTEDEVTEIIYVVNQF